MAQEYLISWGKHAFEKGLSLSQIENYLQTRGMRQKEALKALHEITAFEHKIHQEAEDIRKDMISIPLLFLLILSGIIFFYLAGIMK